MKLEDIKSKLQDLSEEELRALHMGIRNRRRTAKAVTVERAQTAEKKERKRSGATKKDLTTLLGEMSQDQIVALMAKLQGG
jgi:hypothetical protein